MIKDFPSQALPPQQVRHHWLDALRGIAVLGMLHTHVVNSFLAPAWRESPSFYTLNFLHGLVAPTFLWVAGYVFGLGMWHRLTLPPTPFQWKKVARLLVIAGIGYALHLPLKNTPADWSAFWAVDILQCLAFSLLLLMFTEKIISSVDQVKMSKPLGLLILSGLGVMAIQGANHLPNIAIGLPGFDSYFDSTGRSLFPLLPWFGFVAAGAIIAAIPVQKFTFLAIPAILLSLISQSEIFSTNNPAFFFQRLGCLLLFAVVLQRIGTLFAYPRWLLLAGRESLIIYVAHLAVLHWPPWRTDWFHSFHPISVETCFLLLALLCLAIAYGNEGLKLRVSAKISP